ncbi:hypothetical protein [[Flexibacter] sp. ATCC 35208]|uniref:hypothetical protein n=1 Tax=[Flexibacter] sp. ATCC 35208 TaxID=1936242 RepID=UPI0009C9FE88|nr:hypothetical protein [[Flexibacter] sp. ATCC 35208]OMP80052.1 hypothetical protein BW716_06045 [[Flexibacter] sp. ATCC 35208]
MEQLLKQELYNFLVDNNPDMIVRLQQEQGVNNYLDTKVNSISSFLNELLEENLPADEIEAQCMAVLTGELRPSKYLYIKNLLETDFEKYYLQWREAGILTYEIINLITHCNEVFDQFGFSEQNEEDRLISYAVLERINDYILTSEHL